MGSLARLDGALKSAFAGLIEAIRVVRNLRAVAGRLANPNFAGKAPPEVVAECRTNLAEAEAQAALAQGRLNGLG
jgi:valyl-tRNA synthetase